MSRRIVQISAIAGIGDTLYALDNNGIAWKLLDGVLPKWTRLPALPSIDTRPRPQPDALQMDIEQRQELERGLAGAEP